MKKIVILLLAALALTSGGCAWFVSKDEVSDMKTRIGKISKMVRKRRSEEKLLGEAITKARRELSKIMEVRQRYRTSQAAFIRKVRGDLALLRERLATLQGALSKLQGRVDGTLKRNADETTAVLKARAKELVELEATLSQLAAFSLREKPQGLLAIIKALADAKQWKLLHGYLGAFLLKHPTDPLLEEGLYYAVLKLQAAKEIRKTLLYSTLAVKKFPQGKHTGALLKVAGDTYYKLSDCTRALLYLEKFLATQKGHKEFSQVEKSVKTIKSQRHSRQYCAQ